MKSQDMQQSNVQVKGLSEKLFRVVSEFSLPEKRVFLREVSTAQTRILIRFATDKYT